MSNSQAIIHALKLEGVDDKVLHRALSDTLVIYQVKRNEPKKSYDALIDGLTGTHTTRLYDDGGIFCSCGDFQIRKRVCKHIVKLLLNLDSTTFQPLRIEAKI